MLFASLILERLPLEFADLPGAFTSWLQTFGALATAGLIIWAYIWIFRTIGFRESAEQFAVLTLLCVFVLVLVFSTVFGPVVRAVGLMAVLGVALLWVASTPILLPSRGKEFDDLRTPQGMVGLLGLSATILSYAAFAVLLGMQEVSQGPGGHIVYTWAQEFAQTLAGAFAVATVSFPVLLTLFRSSRPRRIWALARLSIKEAWSKGIVWVALIIPLIYLYSDWYLTPSAYKDQLAQRVKMVYLALTLLFVVSALLLGSFNIPTDVKNQTIHTIVTKPVQRYEIVLGRFLGYALLLFVELAALTALSLVYVVRGLHPEAQAESYHARETLLAKSMGFYGTRGESVGREWGYRKYFGGINPQGGASKQYAVWYFNHLPGSLANREKPVRIEYSFDIFRTTKGDEKVQGVECTFTFAPGHLRPEKVDDTVRQLDKEHNQNRVSYNDLAQKYGVYVARKVKVADYHTLPLDVPAALFNKLYSDQGSAPNRSEDGSPAPAMQVMVNLEARSGPQMLGVARPDLYILAGDEPFWLNFIKGSISLWFIACLVLGLALTCSTYLSGVISLLATASLCTLSLFREHIESLAAGTSVGGGPGEAFLRMSQRRSMAVQLDSTSTAVAIFKSIDQTFSWFLRLVKTLIPDVTRLDLTQYVASGFNISLELLIADTLVPLLGYLVPCAILAYYLMNSREIANPT